MKRLVNPTAYFYEKMGENQAMQRQTYQGSIEIQNFVKELINREKCTLCGEFYGLQNHIPRILIHCGHTFCTECLQKFHQNNRVRCPICLKLIKKLFSPELLPMNHTIIRNLLKKQLQNSSNNYSQQEIHLKIQSYLYSEFGNLLRENLKIVNPPLQDQNLGLSYCVYHSQKIQHYFCVYHETPGCKNCMSQGHNLPNLCKVVNVYDVRELKQKQRVKKHKEKVAEEKERNEKKEEMVAQFEECGSSSSNSSSSSSNS